MCESVGHRVRSLAQGRGSARSSSATCDPGAHRRLSTEPKSPRCSPRALDNSGARQVACGRVAGRRQRAVSANRTGTAPRRPSRGAGGTHVRPRSATSTRMFAAARSWKTLTKLQSAPPCDSRPSGHYLPNRCGKTRLRLENSVLAAAPVAGVGAAQGDGWRRPPTHPRAGGRALRCRGCSGRSRRSAARRALVTLVARRVPRGRVRDRGRRRCWCPPSQLTYPSWEAGPLHVLHGPLSHLLGSPHGLNIGLSAVLVVMLVAYAAVLATVRSLSMRAIVITVVALHVILLLSPPQQLTDLFNYLGYARLGGLHHLNPYTHPIAARAARPGVPVHDLASPAAAPTGRCSRRSPIRWRGCRCRSPTGSLKVITVLMSLTFIALVGQCARAARARPAVRGRCSWRPTRSS